MESHQTASAFETLPLDNDDANFQKIINGLTSKEQSALLASLDQYKDMNIDFIIVKRSSKLLYSNINGRIGTSANGFAQMVEYAIEMKVDNEYISNFKIVKIGEYEFMWGHVGQNIEPLYSYLLLNYSTNKRAFFGAIIVMIIAMIVTSALPSHNRFLSHSFQNHYDEYRKNVLPNIPKDLTIIDSSK